VGSDSLAAEFGSFMTTFPDLFFSTCLRWR